MFTIPRRQNKKNSRAFLARSVLCFLSSNGKVQELKNVYYLTQVLVWGQKKSLLLLRCYWENRGRRAEKKPKKLSESLSMFFYVGTLGASNSGGQWFRSHFFFPEKIREISTCFATRLLLLMLLEKQLALHYKKVLKISKARPESSEWK